MNKSNITNNHFRAVLSELKNIMDNDQEPPEELVMQFVAELRVSNLLVPGIINGDGMITENIVSDEDGSVAIPLYTDDEEFIKNRNPDSQYDPMPNDIRQYIDWVNEDDHRGIVINLSSECFFIDRELLNELSFDDDFEIRDKFEGYGPQQLKGIAETASNESMLEFIRNSSNGYSYEGIMLELSKSTMLNLIINDRDFECDGYISLDDVEGWEVCNYAFNGSDVGILFTGRDAITDTLDAEPGYYYAYQITVLSEFIDYVLRQDFDGIIINPGLDEFFIPRGFLLGYSQILDNPSFKNALHYAFLLE